MRTKDDCFVAVIAVVVAVAVVAVVHQNHVFAILLVPLLFKALVILDIFAHNF